MKRFISALTLCVSLLVLLSLFLFPPVEAKENTLLTLLNLPAPPPPNPLITAASRNRDPKFYSKSNPPKDNAPIGELLDYWRVQAEEFRDLGYNPKPSDESAARIYAELEKNPKLLGQYLNIMPDGQRSADLVKEIYDREGVNGAFSRDERTTIKRWLTYHSPFFSNDLARIAEQAGDADEYVVHHEDLLALTRVDYDKAKPIIDRLSSSSGQKASQVLAKWARYKHALATNSVGDIETYREELKAVVENKGATNGMRDLALDALATEKEWPGRDDWYYALLGDETLADLKVNGSTYTGLTTMLIYAPDEKYVEKMLELVRSDNPHVRAAAVRNLVLRLNTGNPEIIRALIPWLEDPKWAVDSGDARGTLIRQLSEVVMPESVPGLIRVLDENQPRTVYPNANANAANRAANSVFYSGNANAAVANAMRATDAIVSTLSNMEVYPHRISAVSALGKQKDIRAVPALRRILPEGESYERGNTVKAILSCNGFTVAEQLDALETAAKGIRAEMDAEDSPANGEAANHAADNVANHTANVGNFEVYRQKRPITANELRSILADQLQQATEISDELARGIVNRIENIEDKDPRMGAAYRRMILKWQNAAINIMLLRDVKRGIATSDTVVRLLGQRKALRENQPSDVFDVRTGGSVAIGFAACLIEDANDYAPILETGDNEAKTALLACSRLVRAPLPVAKVAENLKSPNNLLKIAAERYLESEDSPQARSIILAMHPNEAVVLGARTAFNVEGVAETSSEYLFAIYQSLGNESLYNGWYGSGNDSDLIATEKSLRAEVKKDSELVGLYSYDGNYVRLYKDRVIFSWDEDDSRYRERPLTKYEYDELQSYIAVNNADELPPFISCGGAYCVAKELLMLNRNGGRRVYMNGGDEMFAGTRGYVFFNGLDKYFADLKHGPATLKYTLSREIAGLEIVMATDDLHAETIWKDGGDLRIAASATTVRKQVSAEIENLDESGLTPVDLPEKDGQKAAIQRERRRYEGFAWYKPANGGFEVGAAQPPQVEFIPFRDGLTVQPSDEQWKARAGDFEIRSSPDGLFKLVRGKLSRIRPGSYQNVLVTPDGRWALATKGNENTETQIVRVDLATNKEYPVKLEGYGEKFSFAYVASLNKVLVARNDNYDYPYLEIDDTVPIDADPTGMVLVDVATGAVQPIPGEFGPLSQQTFRPLQKSAKPNESWAAVPDPEKNETQVGLYNLRTFTFTPVLRVPKIKFNSMSMWIDEAGSKVYFVYRGHALALPISR